MPVFNRLPLIITLGPDVDLGADSLQAPVVDDQVRVVSARLESSHNAPNFLFVARPVGWEPIQDEDVIVLTVHNPLDPS